MWDRFDRMAITLGLLHPGEMGASVGAAARSTGVEVLWCSAGRSDATRTRAENDGLVAVSDVGELLARSDVVVCVCPPASALSVARQVAEHRFGGLYVDANAVSPETARAIGAAVSDRGASFVDGGIVGPPVRRAGRTILYLSGARCAEVEDAFRGSLLETHVVGDRVGEASALKMAFSGWTKGSAALLLAVRALAESEGVVDGLRHAWSRFGPELEARVESTASGTAPKAWRFAPEMREISATFSAAGLPGGFHEAAADVYERMAVFKDGDGDLERVLQALLGR